MEKDEFKKFKTKEDKNYISDFDKEVKKYLKTNEDKNKK
jgi:hypothetical protein